MRLKHLAIANCSRISDIDIDVRDNLVLIGPNGSGKTTVLVCLDMLLGMSEEQLYDAFAPNLIRDESRPMTMEAVFADFDDDELAAFPREIFTAGGNDLPIRLEAHRDGDTCFVSRFFPGSKGRRNPSEAQTQAFGWNVLQAQSSLQDICEGVEFAAEAVASSAIMGIDLGPEAEIVSELAEYTDGMRTLFTMAIHELIREDVNILAIDEPEAHLHPSSQRSLAKMLKTGKCQKVLVTHSPTIAGSFQPDEIVVIRADGCAIQPKARFLKGNAGMLARWWIGKQLEPLTAGSVIAVEGPSDRIIVDKVASASGFDLDRHDVVVVETSGCGDMKVIESIFGAGGFDIPLFELIDKDAADETARRLRIDEADLETHNVFVSTRDLEDEYVHAIGVHRLWDKFKEDETFPKSALAVCKKGPDGYPTEATLAQFIREKSKRKIPAALAAASLIDKETASRVRSVAKLVNAASA